ncbi:unnamed protein product [Macrosiphum euphorbiae]|uniref:Ig-like domain-containing protein n=1 Tax=Macrosiphum euphorbiae TaxID=13131 RepID=A0AAV0Y9A6_9HEMI|nr:unnamed protein product [Macrosiphum euphorbiae]
MFTIGNIIFTIEPSNIISTAGKTVRLDCEANFDGVVMLPQYRWNIANGQYLDFIGDTKRSILKNGSLNNIFNNDENVLKVYRRLKKKPTDLSLLSEQIAYFPCLVNSKPLPINIIWFKYNSLLVTDNRMAIFPSGALEINDVHENDVGAYRCNITVLNKHRLSDAGMMTIVHNEDTIKR